MEKNRDKKAGHNDALITTITAPKAGCRSSLRKSFPANSFLPVDAPTTTRFDGIYSEREYSCDEDVAFAWLYNTHSPVAEMRSISLPRSYFSLLVWSQNEFSTYLRYCGSPLQRGSLMAQRRKGYLHNILKGRGQQRFSPEAPQHRPRRAYLSASHR